MQNKKTFLIALTLSLIAVLMVYSYIARKESRLMEMTTPITLVVAAKDIPAGTMLDTTLLKKIKMPKKYNQPGSGGEMDRFVDRITAVPILKETQILETMLSITEQGGVSEKIPPGYRGFSIAVSNVTAVAGLLQPGDFVDIMVTVETGAYSDGNQVSEEILTKTILQNVLVIAANQVSTVKKVYSSVNFEGDEKSTLFSKTGKGQDLKPNLRTITLALKPLDVQKMNLVQEVGSISIALRSRWEEKNVEELPALKARDFLGIKNSVVPRSRPAWVEIRGAEQIYR